MARVFFSLQTQRSLGMREEDCSCIAGTLCVAEGPVQPNGLAPVEKRHLGHLRSSCSTNNSCSVAGGVGLAVSDRLSTQASPKSVALSTSGDIHLEGGCALSALS